MDKILIVGATDPSMGAGIILDSLVALEHGVFPYTAITAVIAQNSIEVLSTWPLTESAIEDQLDAALAEGNISSVKCGALLSTQAVETLAKRLSGLKELPFVLDPVLASSSGKSFVDEKILSAIIDSLFPLATVITPNIKEVEMILKTSIKSEADIEKAAKALLNLGPKWTLIKGGHFHGQETVDRLFGKKNERFFGPRIDGGEEVRGTGCMHATSLASNLIKGADMIEAAEWAKKFVEAKLERATLIGKGRKQTLPDKFWGK